MPERQRRKSSVGPQITLALTVFVVLLTLYILGYGPAYVAVTNGQLSPDELLGKIRTVELLILRG